MLAFTELKNEVPTTETKALEDIAFKHGTQVAQNVKTFHIRGVFLEPDQTTDGKPAITVADGHLVAAKATMSRRPMVHEGENSTVARFPTSMTGEHTIFAKSSVASPVPITIGSDFDPTAVAPHDDGHRTLGMRVKPTPQEDYDILKKMVVFWAAAKMELARSTPDGVKNANKAAKYAAVYRAFDAQQAFLSPDCYFEGSLEDPIQQFLLSIAKHYPVYGRTAEEVAAPFNLIAWALSQQKITSTVLALLAEACLLQDPAAVVQSGFAKLCTNIGLNREQAKHIHMLAAADTATAMHLARGMASTIHQHIRAFAQHDFIPSTKMMGIMKFIIFATFHADVDGTPTPGYLNKGADNSTVAFEIHKDVAATDWPAIFNRTTDIVGTYLGMPLVNRVQPATTDAITPQIPLQNQNNQAHQNAAAAANQNQNQNQMNQFQNFQTKALQLQMALTNMDVISLENCETIRTRGVAFLGWRPFYAFQTDPITGTMRMQKKTEQTEQRHFRGVSYLESAEVRRLEEITTLILFGGTARATPPTPAELIKRVKGTHADATRLGKNKGQKGNGKKGKGKNHNKGIDNRNSLERCIADFTWGMKPTTTLDIDDAKTKLQQWLYDVIMLIEQAPIAHNPNLAPPQTQAAALHARNDHSNSPSNFAFLFHRNIVETAPITINVKNGPATIGYQLRNDTTAAHLLTQLLIAFGFPPELLASKKALKTATDAETAVMLQQRYATSQINVEQEFKDALVLMNKLFPEKAFYSAATESSDCRKGGSIIAEAIQVRTTLGTNILEALYYIAIGLPKRYKNQTEEMEYLDHDSDEDEADDSNGWYRLVKALQRDIVTEHPKHRQYMIAKKEAATLDSNFHMNSHAYTACASCGSYDHSTSKCPHRADPGLAPPGTQFMDAQEKGKGKKGKHGDKDKKGKKGEKNRKGDRGKGDRGKGGQHQPNTSNANNDNNHNTNNNGGWNGGGWSANNSWQSNNDWNSGPPHKKHKPDANAKPDPNNLQKMDEMESFIKDGKFICNEINCDAEVTIGKSGKKTYTLHLTNQNQADKLPKIRGRKCSWCCQCKKVGHYFEKREIKNDEKNHPLHNDVACPEMITYLNEAYHMHKGTPGNYEAIVHEVREWRKNPFGTKAIDAVAAAKMKNVSGASAGA